MLLTLTTTHRPATDLGYLLHKHPERCFTDQLAFGKVHILYPEATVERCTAALLLEVDPVALVRRSQGEFVLRQYVNDRPYAASSLLSVAIARTLASALGGRSKERPELAQTSIPLQAGIPALPCRGGEELLRRLFEPLGWAVEAERLPLDAPPKMEGEARWRGSHYFTVTLRGQARLAELLEHLYVLIPVLDDDKHYWVGESEVDKLLRRGGNWLASHPERELIIRRYLRHQKHLERTALGRLMTDEPAESEEKQAAEEVRLEKPTRLHDVRLATVCGLLKTAGAHRVLDLGCGEGRLLALLRKDRSFTEIVGVDVAHRALKIAARRLRLDRRPPELGDRLRLLQGSLTYRDRRLEGFDGAAVVEVIEHLDPSRLDAFSQALFACAKPRTVIITTPNADYNVLFPDLAAGRFRHRDHRFEWTREEFRAWVESITERFHYHATFHSIGEEDPQHGAPCQAVVFTQ
jgi:3' terminal RNA ribose 2'-O-methyltransferase Hen1